jgi:hypothetical protein
MARQAGLSRLPTGPERTPADPYFIRVNRYQTNGPYYGGVFAPGQVHGTKVGTATFHADTVDTGQITYSVNSVQALKAVQRKLLQYKRQTITASPRAITSPMQTAQL